MLFVAGGGGRSRVSTAQAAIGARLNARQSPLTGCRRPQDCIQAIKALAKGRAPLRLLHPLEIQKSFPRAWPDLQRMKLLLPGGAVLPGQFPPSFPPGLARPAAHETSATRGAVLPGKFLPSFPPGLARPAAHETSATRWRGPAGSVSS